MGVDFVPTGIQTGVAGSMMGTEVVTTIAAATRVILAAGLYFYYAVGVNITLQVLDSTGAWQNVTAAGVGGVAPSDGTDVAFFNAGGGNQTVKTQKIG